MTCVTVSPQLACNLTGLSMAYALLIMCIIIIYIVERVGVLSSKTLSSNALSSKTLSSNGTLVGWNFGRMEHWSNGTLVEWNIGRMELWSNGILVEWNFGRMEHWSNGTFV